MCVECFHGNVVARRWSTGSGSLTATQSRSGGGSNNQPSGYNRMQRALHVNRARRSGVIVGTRPLVPASVVPEELVSQVSEGVGCCRICDVSTGQCWCSG